MRLPIPSAVIPATVMGRTALVLLAALALALAGALMVFSAHRGQALLAQGLDGAAERVADIVGMAEGASRHWLDERRSHSTALRPATHADAERLAKQVADLAWAGLRQVRPT